MTYSVRFYSTINKCSIQNIINIRNITSGNSHNNDIGSLISETTEINLKNTKILHENNISLPFSHLDSSGNASMVDISNKKMTFRHATAQGFIQMSKPTQLYLSENKKGDVFTVAKIAGIQAAKNTSSMVPLCHSLHLSHVDIRFKVSDDGVLVESSVKTDYGTGCEMEAIMSTMVSLATIYDMCKAVDKGMVIGEIKLMTKTGGKGGDFFQIN